MFGSLFDDGGHAFCFACPCAQVVELWPLEER